MPCYFIAYRTAALFMCHQGRSPPCAAAIMGMVIDTGSVLTTSLPGPICVYLYSACESYILPGASLLLLAHSLLRAQQDSFLRRFREKITCPQKFKNTCARKRNIIFFQDQMFLFELKFSVKTHSVKTYLDGSVLDWPLRRWNVAIACIE